MLAPGNKGPGTKARASFLAAALGVCVLLTAGGCQEQIFVADEPRSQYDRFDAIRDRRAQSYVEDEFGRRRPNLRGRLLTSE